MADIPVYESDAGTHVTVTAPGQTNFNFDFLAFRPEQLRVLYYPVTGGPSIELHYPEDFSASGIDNPNGGEIELIALVTAVDDRFYIWRDTPIEREKDWQNEGDYKADLVNAEQDEIYMILQELKRDIALAVSVAPGEEPPTAGQIDGWVQDAMWAASGAETARDHAQQWASNPENVPINDGVNPEGFSAFSHSKKSEASATASAASALAASNSKDAAGLSAGAAAGSASAAAGSAAAAAGSAAAAAVSKDAAALSAGAAASSASAANDDATAAAGSASAAQSSAADAQASKNSAANSASSAEASKNFSHEWSSAPENTPVDDGTNQGFSAYHWSKKAESAAGGGVQSVGLSAPTGFSVSDSPVTNSGTLTLAYASGYTGFTTALETKLNGIEAGATANQSDDYLLDRANHTGKMPVSGLTVTGSASFVLGRTATSGDAGQVAMDQAATDNSVARRGTGGVLKVGTPTADGDAATKKYVDDLAGGIGAGQTWQDVRASRVVGTTYQNTGSAPIGVSVGGSSTVINWSQNGTSWLIAANGIGGPSGGNGFAIIPPGDYYKVTGGTPWAWTELR